MSVNFSTAKGIVELKILRNNYITELFKLEDKILRKELKFRIALIDNIKIKIKKMDDMNIIEEKQKTEYTLSRENDILFLTENIKDLDTSPHIETIKTEIHDLQRQIQKILFYIIQLNKQIPASTYITNFKCVLYDPNESCHQAGL